MSDISSIGTEPACWMQIGYASGYSTEFMGRPVLYREVECQSMGQPACRIVGKPVEDWGDEAAADLRYLSPDGMQTGLTQHRRPPASARCVLPSEAIADPTRAVGISPGFNAALHMVQEGRADAGHRAVPRRERGRQGGLRAHDASPELAPRADPSSR